MIEGTPSFEAQLEVGFNANEDATFHGLLATAKRAVNAIPWVCAASSGLVDAPHIPNTATQARRHPGPLT